MQNNKILKFLKNKKILITGGTGSFWKNCFEQIFENKYKRDINF